MWELQFESTVEFVPEFVLKVETLVVIKGADSVIVTGMRSDGSAFIADRFPPAPYAPFTTLLGALGIF